MRQKVQKKFSDFPQILHALFNIDDLATHNISFL